MFMLQLLLPQTISSSPVTFDEGWRFFRGACPAISAAPNGTSSPCASSTFDDTTWRMLDLPHDWSREDLPPREQDHEYPVISARYLPWRLQSGDNQAWVNPFFDDSSWHAAEGGVDWRRYGDGAFNRSSTVSGFYRARLSFPAWMAASSNKVMPIISLGIVAGSADVWVNGVHIGGTTMNATADYTTFLRYALPSLTLLQPGSGNVVIAVRVRTFPVKLPGRTSSSVAAGGLYDDPSLDGLSTNLAPKRSATSLRSGPFDPAASPGQGSTGYTLGGKAWYRKSFPTPPLVASKGDGTNAQRPRLLLRFDGIYQNSVVYVNGILVGDHPYGYTAAEYDITSFLVQPPLASNLVAVSVNNTGENSRWYSGSGIYRHTWLTLKDPDLSIPTSGVAVDTVVVEGEHSVSAALSVAVEVHSTTNRIVRGATITLEITLSGAGGGVVATLAGVPVNDVRPHATVITRCNVTLASNVTKLWSPNSPTLYTARVSLHAAALRTSTRTSHTAAPIAIDTSTAHFGIRSVEYNATHGFQLNGVTMKMRGGCVHHANGPLGAMAIDRADERRVAALKRLGYNAVRAAHNPPSPAFLDACDRLGVLVIDENFDCWSQGKKPQDYHLAFDAWWRRDMTAMIRRDRNHPSIVMWSIGNEIPMRFTHAALNISLEMRALIDRLDNPHSGRAITSAYPMLNEQDSDFLHALDVPGYNYEGWQNGGKDVYQIDHERLPNRVMVGTESLPDTSAEQWGRIWNKTYVVGDFIWTAIDYIGESGIASGADDGEIDQSVERKVYPFHHANSGDLDLILTQKPQSVYRAVLWNVSRIGILVHGPVPFGVTEVLSPWGWPNERSSWTWPKDCIDTPLQVRVFAKGCARAVLHVNGKHVGDAPFHPSNFTAVFAAVTYEPGTLAVSTSGCGATHDNNSRYHHSDPSATLKTATAPVALRLVIDRTTIAHRPTDLAFVTVEVVDATGMVHPSAAFKLRFAIQGIAGKLIAVGNGDPHDTSSWVSTRKTTWRGRALGVIQPNVSAAAGVINITVSSIGLASASAQVVTYY